MTSQAKQPLTFRMPFSTKSIIIDRWQTYFLGSFIFLGLSARLRNYLAEICFWSDEAALANNLVAMSFSQLFGPLNQDQVAPIGFCLFEKFLMVVWGNHEFALKLLPFISGSAAIILAFIFVYRVLGPLPAILCAAQLAVIKEPLFYANDFKPYASDLAIALGLATLAWSETFPLLSRKRYWALFIGGTVAVWFSFPALFVLGAVAIAYWIKLLQERHWKAAGPLALMCVAWLISFAIQYYLLQSEGKYDNLTQGWSARFVILLPKSLNDLLHNWESLYRVFRDPLWTSHPIISIPLYIAGCVLLWKKKPYFLFFILIPLVLNFIASGVHAYPFKDRLLQYAVIFLFIPIAYSLTHMVTVTSRHHWIKWLGVVLIVANLAEPSVNAIKHIYAPRRHEEMGPVVTYIKTNKNETDSFFVHAHALKTFTYYSNRFNLDYHRLTVSREVQKSTPELIDNEIYALSDRVWLVFGHAKQFKGVDFEAQFLKAADHYGKRIDQYIDEGAATYLYLFP